MPKEPSSTFVFRFDNIQDAEDFERFKLLTMVFGHQVNEQLMRFVRHYNEKHPVDFDILPETDILERLENEGIGITRQTLKKYRDSGGLKDKNGNQAWYTDGFSIVYNWQAVEAYVKKYRGKSKIKRLQNAA